MAKYFEYLNLPMSKLLFFLLAFFVINPITYSTDFISLYFNHFFNLNSLFQGDLRHLLSLFPYTRHFLLVLNN